MTDLRKAAEMALEALEEGIDNMWSIRRENAIQALRKALAQQDKECVAIVNNGMGGIEWLSPPLPDDTPLYVELPKREWVGLTDEDIATELTKEFGQWWSRHVSVCRAIEVKLRSKNT